MKKILISAALAAIVLGTTQVPAAAATSVSPRWLLSTTGTDARLRGLSAVSAQVAWASGSGGTVLRTVDGGQTWQRSSPPDSAGLELRDIEAFDADTAVTMTIGPGEQSRFYRTDDGGRSWRETFRNTDPAAFFDCVAFFDRQSGLALSDPVNGKFRVLSTEDGGRSWTVLSDDGMPAALPNEFAFAASGQCISVGQGRNAWISTGGGDRARVLRSTDRGRTWTASDTVLASGASAGVFATAWQGPNRGIAVGGDYAAPTSGKDALGITRDGGRTWQKPRTAPQGYRSGVTWHPVAPNIAIAVGPTGSDITVDSGRSWHQFDTGSFDTVDCAPSSACWAAGERGRVARLGMIR